MRKSKIDSADLLDAKVFEGKFWRLIIDHGYNQKGLARELGVSAATLRAIAVSKQLPSAYTTIKLCRLFGAEEMISFLEESPLFKPKDKTRWLKSGEESTAA